MIFYPTSPTKKRIQKLFGSFEDTPFYHDIKALKAPLKAPEMLNCSEI